MGYFYCLLNPIKVFSIVCNVFGWAGIQILKEITDKIFNKLLILSKTEEGERW